MRRFRRSHRRSGRSSSRRRYHWEGGNVGGVFTLGMGPDNAMQYLFWIKWPSGLRQTTDETGILRTGELTAVDETLIRLRWLIGMTTSSVVNNAFTINMGAIIWECNDPGTFDNIVQTGGPPGEQNANPDPTYDVSDDWIIRKQYFVVGGALSAVAFFGDDQVDHYESRAKRKLPAGAGILGVISGVGTEGGGSSEFDLIMMMDVRALYKSGIYGG